MRILVVGLGSIGRRHIQNLKKFNPDFRIAVLRQKSENKDLGDIQDLVTSVFFDMEHALSWEPEAAIICNPAPMHVPTARKLVQKGIHLFIEKPLSDSLKEIDALLDECAAQRAVLMVGYCLRFLEPLMKLKEEIAKGTVGKILNVRAAVGRYLLDWRPGMDYRTNVSARKDLGGGVLLELSHELDYVRWLFGEVKDVCAYVEKVSDLEIDVEDSAEINMHLKSGVLANIHLDMLDRASNRSCRIIGSEGTLTWDYDGEHRVRLFSGKTQTWTDLWAQENYDYQQMYIDQFKHFFECIEKGAEPNVSGREGKRVLEIALAAKESARKGTVISV